MSIEGVPVTTTVAVLEQHSQLARCYREYRQEILAPNTDVLVFYVPLGTQNGDRSIITIGLVLSKKRIS